MCTRTLESPAQINPLSSERRLQNWVQTEAVFTSPDTLGASSSNLKNQSRLLSRTTCAFTAIFGPGCARPSTEVSSLNETTSASPGRIITFYSHRWYHCSGVRLWGKVGAHRLRSNDPSKGEIDSWTAYRSHRT